MLDLDRFWIGFTVAAIIGFLLFLVKSRIIWLFIPPPNRWFH